MDQLVEELKQDIEKLRAKCGDKYDLSADTLSSLYSVYPFNTFEYVVSHLIAEGIITLDRYLDIRNAYLEKNKYLYIFEITAPRTFGETWAQRHLNELVPELKRPSRDYHSEYSGEYDFWYEGVRIEVKASRAVKRSSGDSLINKALASDSSSGFDMNFQQIKPRYCDVFIWIGVWRDVIRYWVLSSHDIESNKYYSTGQHRGNVGEGQLWIKDSNIHEFDKYLAGPRGILEKIQEKALEQKRYATER
jgi:hypothetical protein